MQQYQYTVTMNEDKYCGWDTDSVFGLEDFRIHLIHLTSASKSSTKGLVHDSKENG